MSELSDAIARERRNLAALERLAREQRAALAATPEAIALEHTNAEIARVRYVLRIAKAITPPTKARSA